MENENFSKPNLNKEIKNSEITNNVENDNGAAVPPNGMPVPPNGMPVPPNGMPVPPNGMPVPPNGMPVPPNGMLINQQNMFQQRQQAFREHQRRSIFERFKDNPVANNYNKIAAYTLVYAIIAAIFAYKNIDGLAMVLFAIGTGLFYFMTFKVMKCNIKPMSVFCMVSIGIFGISSCLTSGPSVYFNFLAIVLLSVLMIVEQRFECGKWNLSESITNYFEQLFGAIGSIDDVFSFKKVEMIVKNGEQQASKKGMEKLRGKASVIIIGLAISIPIVIFVLGILSSADAVFEEAIKKIIDIDFIIKNLEKAVEWVIAGLCVYVFVLMNLIHSYKRVGETQLVSKKRYDATIAIVIGIMLTLVYLLFCVIQIRYLFLGSSGELPGGVTYSEYARTGFWQLVFVSVINLMIVLVGINIFEENIILKLVMLAITVCTYIIIASSAVRMLKYIQVRYLTYQRMVVLLALIILSVLFIGVLINIFYDKFPLFRYGVVVLTVFYMVFSFTRPEYIIAKVNLDNADESTQYAFFKDSKPFDDFSYISKLGMDAATVIIDDITIEEIEKGYENLVNIRKEYFSDYSNRDKKKMPFRVMYVLEKMEELEDEAHSIRTWNLSKNYVYNLTKDCIKEMNE